MVNDSELIKEVLAVEREWVDAHCSMDFDILCRILGENYRQIKPDGTVIGREELIKSYRSGSRSWDIAKGDNYEVRVLERPPWLSEGGQVVE